MPRLHSRTASCQLFLFVCSLLALSTVAELRGSQVDARTNDAAVESGSGNAMSRPFVLPLRRESVAVKRRGKVVSFKTSYSGIIHVGSPKPQEFRVVFDTGSGHVVLPARECKSESCLIHRRFSMKKSRTAKAINMDGSRVFPGDVCDQVTIGYGTGEITGEFVLDGVCVGPAPPKSKSKALATSGASERGPCKDMHIIAAVEMSSQPFRAFGFDGIIGMGLSSLALTSNFSFFHLPQEGSNQTDLSQFGVFLNEGEGGEESELAIGGHNQDRMMEPLNWAPVSNAALGHWQVAILAIRINGQPIEACKHGCRGIIDTGTSHWGVPSPHDEAVTDLLTVPAGDIVDCRLAQAPVVEIELAGFNITLHPRNYMRRLPLRDGITVGAKRGAAMPNASVPRGVALPSGTNVTRRCKPKVMAINLPAPLGPDVFIFGEPLLHRYYTVFDSKAPRVGFALAAHRMNIDGPDRGHGGLGALPDEVDVLL